MPTAVSARADVSSPGLVLGDVVFEFLHLLHPRLCSFLEYLLPDSLVQNVPLLTQPVHALPL